MGSHRLFYLPLAVLGLCVGLGPAYAGPQRPPGAQEPPGPQGLTGTGGASQPVSALAGFTPRLEDIRIGFTPVLSTPVRSARKTQSCENSSSSFFLLSGEPAGSACGCREEDQYCGTADCRFGGCGPRGCGGCCGYYGIPVSEDGCGVCCNEDTGHVCGYGAICCGRGCCPEDRPVCCEPPDGSPAFCCAEDERCDPQARRCVPR